LQINKQITEKDSLKCVTFENVYIRLYVSLETFETNLRSNAIYWKTLQTFTPNQ